MKKKIEFKPVLKKFLMTLAATTISIILTFGTSAIVDGRKQKARQKEMVMMIMYDMSESFKQIEQCDKNLKDFFNQQVDMVAHPQQYQGDYSALLANLPLLNYTLTTENIFRSNIETINTLGNILFIEAVSSFYDQRKRYKNEVIDEFIPKSTQAVNTLEGLSALDTSYYCYLSEISMSPLQRLLEQCKQLMDISDEDLEGFRTKRDKMIEALEGDKVGEMMNRLVEEKAQRDAKFQKAKEEGLRKNSKPIL